MKIVIIANSRLGNIDFHKSKIAGADKIICADGGANNALRLGIRPDFIIGDLDSTKKETLELFRKLKTKIILDPDQGKTDLELALKLADSFNPKEIIILCAIGHRLDHTIANILCLARACSNIRMIDENHEMWVIDKEIKLRGKEGDIVSIIPIGDIEGLSYEGLKWGLKEFDAKLGWFGICNKMISATAKISLKKGKIIVIKTRDTYD